MCETYFDRYTCQKPTVPLHPQTNISVSRVLHNSLHFPIKGDLSELKWTNLFGGILCLILVSLMQKWICETNSDKCMSKTTMPLLTYVILNISDSANFFLINCLGIKVINYPQHSRPGLINADRPFMCQSVWNSWMGNILNNKTH